MNARPIVPGPGHAVQQRPLRRCLSFITLADVLPGAAAVLPQNVGHGSERLQTPVQPEVPRHRRAEICDIGESSPLP
jgi:hypothetical protein